MIIRLSGKLQGAWIDVSPDMTHIEFHRDYDPSNTKIRDLNEFETEFVASTIIAVTAELKRALNK